MRIIWVAAGLVALLMLGGLLDLLSTVNAGVWRPLMDTGISPALSEDDFYNYVFLPAISLFSSVLVVWAALRIAGAIRRREE